MKRISADSFLTSKQFVPIIDVRSPVEYQKGHIRGAVNIPIFSNEERHEIGIIYKNFGRETAIEKGLGFVGPKMKALAENAKNLSQNKNRKVYCWRGGMRSEKMSWLFELLGMKCNVLEGGYKAYRNLQISDFKNIKILNTLYGSTGSGKTDILQQLKVSGEQVIDLEGLANHKGSAFGHIGMPEQPTSQQFHNDIHKELSHFNLEHPIWIEGESLKIGNVNLPDELWFKMKTSNIIEIKIDRKKRLEKLVNEYGACSKIELAKSVRNLKNKISADKIKAALYFIEIGDFSRTADLLLNYYDRTYDFSRQRFRDNTVISIKSNSGDPKVNAQKILNMSTEMIENK